MNSTNDAQSVCPGAKAPFTNLKATSIKKVFTDHMTLCFNNLIPPHWSADKWISLNSPENVLPTDWKAASEIQTSTMELEQPHYLQAGDHVVPNFRM